MTEIETIIMPAETAKEFGIAAEKITRYDLVRVTTSDYDEGGNNTVTMCFPCLVEIPLDNKDVAAAIEVCRKNGAETLAFQLERTRKNEKFFPLLERLARREIRYFLSVTKLGKNIS